FFHELQDGSHELIGTQNQSCNDWFLNLADELGLRKLCRIVDLFDLSIRPRDAVSNAGSRRDQRKLKLAFQPLLDDFHVEQSEKPASKTKSQRSRSLRLIKE